MSQREWLLLAVFTFISISGWITYEVYHSLSTSSIDNVDESIMQPLNPDLDKDIVIKLLDEN
ncbi:MAG: hypothetical protein Q8Q65_02990 [bacterium]|nr:hypothetical protein [bacterium]